MTIAGIGDIRRYMLNGSQCGIVKCFDDFYSRKQIATAASDAVIAALTHLL